MVSSQGRNVVLLMAAGLLFGLVGSLVQVGGVPLPYFFLQNNSLVYNGAYWQLFTSMIVAPPLFLAIADVMFNAFAILWLDRILSSAYAPAAYYATFLLSGVAGNIVSLAAGPLLSSFGASGGIFGLLAGALTEDFVTEKRLDYSLLIWFLMLFVFSSFLLPQTNWLAHLGGTICGASVGYCLGRRVPRTP